MTLTSQQQANLNTIVRAVVESVNSAGPLGAPGGHLYAALMSQGCTLNQFESLMSALIRAGKVTKQGECYFAV